MILPLDSVLIWILKEAGKRLEKRLMEDEPDVGHNAGTVDGTLTPVGPPNPVQLYHYKPFDADPLRYCHPSGYQFKAGEFYGTDLGSIPAACRNLIPRKYLRLKCDDFVEGYIPHDFICKNKWIYVRNGDAEPWHQMAMSKKQGDVLLHWILSCPTLPREGRPPISATRGETLAIYQAVRKVHALHGE